MTTADTALTVLDWCQYALKGLQVGYAASDIKETLQRDETTNKTLMATSFIFLAFQSADILLSLTKNPEKTVLHARIGAGAFDVARVISKKSAQEPSLTVDDYLDVLNTAMFRTADIGSFIAQHQLSRNPEQVEKGAHIAMAGSLLLAKRKSIMNAPQNAADIERSLRQRIEAFFSRREEREAWTSFMQQNVNRVRTAHDISEWERVPLLFSQDPVLQGFIDQISLRPIRFIRVVDGTQDDPEPVYYERDEIMNWIQSHPGERPPRWPEGTPIDINRLVLSPPRQQMIDDRLNEHLDEVEDIDWDAIFNEN